MMMTSVGPSTQPEGTPLLSSLQLDLVPLIKLPVPHHAASF